MHVVPIPALADNYIWLLHDDAGNALVVDPGEAAPVEDVLARQGWRLRAILLTHHHPDHIAGAAALAQRHGVPIHAPHDERIDHATHRVGDGDTVTLETPAARFQVLAVPGHTRSHVAYAGEGVLLSGDTLFSLGCGRLFEGTAQQMLQSLDRLSALPGDLAVCCGHEYTEANGRFALGVDPDNPDLAERLHQVKQRRAQGQPSVPVPLDSELACNPFLRVDSPALIAWATARGAGDRVERFATLRSAKDAFRG